MVGGHPAPERRRGNSGSTSIELNLYPYTPHPRHGGHAPYSADDQESVRTAVVASPVEDEENLLYGKNSSRTLEGSANRHGGIRTPSPTPSELKELQSGAINWEAMRKWRFWIRREWLCPHH
ncbi:hypothetical protein FA13DRAFT_1807684 [Coprinellus micaceus]|uniref:Uncharacterized protein n=1 Tax=Coprinellus micaceus TaxID=71717 RepID=A0A4Y7R4R5_COPMI|nr:hypothetical protein FA13DRAFT_1807684 [Coprinellus micaceus]